MMTLIFLVVLILTIFFVFGMHIFCLCQDHKWLGCILGCAAIFLGFMLVKLIS